MTRVAEMLKELEWEDLQARRKRSRLGLFYKIIKGEVSLNMNELDMKINTSQTRKNNSFTLKTIKAETNIFKYSFIVKTIPEWNKLSQDTVDSLTVSAFKKALQHKD